MKKHLLFIASMLPFFSFAQITLTQSSYTGTYTSYDTVHVVNGTTGLPTNIGPATSAIWDFSGVTYAGTDSVMYMPAPAGYTNQLFKTDTISSPFLFMPSRGYYTINSAGYQQNVFRLDRRGYTLMGAVLGAGITDSIIFPSQLDTLSSPLNIIKFPAATTGSDYAWLSIYTTKVHFTANAPTLFMNNVPGYNLRYERETDTVKGWGKVIIKRADGTTSLPMDVLEVKVWHNRVDSFFLNGVPAPPSLMQPPFLQQGMTRNTYQYKFYRPNEITPLVELTYTDNTYTTVSSAKVHAQRTVPVPGSVAKIKDGNGIAMYPNPVTGSTVNLELPITAKDWTYKLVNASGQLVTDGNIGKGQAQATVTLPAVAPGIYMLQLTNGEINTVKTVQINK